MNHLKDPEMVFNMKNLISEIFIWELPPKSWQVGHNKAAEGQDRELGSLVLLAVPRTDKTPLCCMSPLSGMPGDTFSHFQPGCSISWPPSSDDTLKWDESRALGVLFPCATAYVRCNPVEIKTYVLPLASAITHRVLRWSEARGHTHTDTHTHTYIKI